MAPNYRKPRSYYHRSQLKLNTAHTMQSHCAIHTTTYAQRSRERKNSDVLFTVTSFVSDFDCLRSLSLLGSFCLVHPFSMCSVSLFTCVFWNWNIYFSTPSQQLRFSLTTYWEQNCFGVEKSSSVCSIIIFRLIKDSRVRTTEAQTDKMSNTNGKRNSSTDINERRKRKRTISNDLLRGSIHHQFHCQ